MGIKMNRFEYVVESLDGDYANLRRTDIEATEPKLVARALFAAYSAAMAGSRKLLSRINFKICF